MKGRRWLWPAAAVFALAVLAAGLPFVRVPWLAGPFRRALVNSFSREIEFSELRGALLPVPSLVAYQVVVAEDPAFGLEPFLYADELRASLSLGALLGGRIEPSAIRLSGASVNLARSAEAGFNLVSFLQKAFSYSRGSRPTPEFSLRESRINFREEVRKSAYYLNAVDLDLEPPSSPAGEFRWRYEASPARTDRPEQGFGRFSGAGRWTPGPGGGRFAVDVTLQRSSISELLLLLAGRDLGLQGRFSAQAFLDGPYHNLRVRGTLGIEEFERAAFFALRGQNYELPFEGRLDLDRQALQLSSTPPAKGGKGLPVQLSLQAEGLLSVPRWKASMAFENLPAEALLELCRRLGIETPEGLRVEAAVSGSAEFATAQPSHGEIRVPKALVRLGDAPPVRARDALIRLDADRFLLEHAHVESPGGAEAELAGSWDPAGRRLEFLLRSGRMAVRELNGALSSFPGLAQVPLVHSCQAGVWSGQLGFVRHFPVAEPLTPAHWSGQLSLAAARCTPPGFRAFITLDRAVIELDGAAWKLRHAEGRFGHSVFQASARRRPADALSTEVHVEASRLEGADLDRLFESALPPQPSLLERTLRRRPPPGGLRDLRVTGSLRAATLLLGRQEFHDVRSDFAWRAASVFLDSLSARWHGFLIQGQAEGRLDRTPARYRVRAVASGALPGGAWADAELEARAAALGPGMETGVTAWAELALPAFSLPEGIARHVHASLEYDGARPQDPWRLPQISLWVDARFWSGRGHASPAGVLRIDWTTPAAAWEGSLWPPAPAPVAR
ncbi:MAG: hypothetical protein ACP5VC_03390 [Bryobacteraceae bacterium]